MALNKLQELGKLKVVLLNWGFVNFSFDVSLFFYKQGSEVVYLVVYVDDILLTWNSP